MTGGGLDLLTASPSRVASTRIPVANFTIASTPRTFDAETREWKDGETLFLRASVWRDAAENVAASLAKGSRVVASGVLKPGRRTREESQQRKEDGRPRLSSS
jgi:single-strand DNA-binding protein